MSSCLCCRLQAPEEAKTTAISEFAMTSKELVISQQQLATAHSTLLQGASDHKTAVAAREAELKVIAERKEL